VLVNCGLVRASCCLARSLDRAAGHAVDRPTTRQLLQVYVQQPIPCRVGHYHIIHILERGKLQGPSRLPEFHCLHFCLNYKIQGGEGILEGR